jgi:ABC-type thiamin/hydroxymethylpyrimidine transport system permease subunit
MTDIQLTLIVIGLVAIARRVVPRVDGALVAIAAVAIAMVTAVFATPSDLAGDLCRGLVTGLTAFGVMTAVRYGTRKLDCLCKRTSDEPAAPPASEEV